MQSRAPSARPEPRVAVIAASAGGVRALIAVLSALPSDFPAPVVIVQHRSLASPSALLDILSRHTPLAVVEAKNGERLAASTIYVARPDHHLTVTPGGEFAYVDGRPIRYVLSSANPLFASSAEVFGADVVAVVLSGAGRDGTDGVRAIKAHGGTVIAQDEATSEFFGMPGSAIESGAVDLVLPIDAIGPELVRLFAAGATPERTGP
jgi:two-component system chemotaxis response regulator CheB